MVEKTLGDVATYINGRAFKPQEWETSGRPIIRIQNLTNSTQECNRTTKQFEEKYRISDGDLLFAWSASLGAHIWHGEDGWLNQHIFKVIPNESIDKIYLYYYLLYVVDQLYAKTHGSGMVHITLKPFKSTRIMLPELNEQRRVVGKIESLFAKLDEAKEKAQAVVDSFETRKAAILHKAFTGELTAKWREEHGVRMESWEKKRLSDVVTEFKYGTSEKSDYNNKGIPVLRIPNIGDNGIDLSDIKYLNHRNVDSESQIHEGDILIIRSNGSRDLVGKAVLVPELGCEYAYASFLIRAKPNHSIINAHYLTIFLNSTDARGQMFRRAKSSAGINNINTKELGAISLTVPSLPEQDEIVHIINEMMDKDQQSKEAAEAVLDQIDLMKKSILARAFRGELGTNDPSEESAVELLMSKDCSFKKLRSI